MKNILRTFSFARATNQGIIHVGSAATLPADGVMIRSVNGGGSRWKATVGCDQAEGSPKGGGPVAGVTLRRKLPPTTTARRQSWVCSDGAAPKAILIGEGLDRPEDASRLLGSGPMSFTQGTHQRPSTKVLRQASTARGRFSTPICAAEHLSKKFGAAPIKGCLALSPDGVPTPAMKAVIERQRAKA